MVLYETNIEYQEVVYMATSTFGKQFIVRPDKVTDLVKEMTKPVAPTLKKNFSSHLGHLTSDTELRNNLMEALKK